MLAIIAAKHLRTFLERSRFNLITAHWCPSHQNIAPNNRVDKMAKEALTHPMYTC